MIDHKTLEQFGIRIPDVGETPLSWEEILVLLKIKNAH